MPAPAWVTQTDAQRRALQAPQKTIVAKDKLLPNASLTKGGRITSSNGEYYFLFQNDGNVALYNKANQAIWSPNIAGRGGTKATMQSDGNFVIYNAQNGAIWSTQSVGHPGAFLIIQPDGNLVVNQNGTAIWHSNTYGGHFHAQSSSPFAAIARTLGGAAKGLASGVSVAAKWSGHAFTDVTSSSLWKIVAGVAPFVLPGIGLAVSAGMVTASVIGKAASVKDAIIGVARANMPGGDAGKAGFDVGIGVAVHGEGMTEASLNAVRNQIPNGPAKIGFDAALSLHAGRVTSTAAPVNLSVQAKAAYYTTKGLINIKAPPAMKKAVAEAVVTSADAHRGMQAAIMNTVNPRDVSWLEWLWHEVKNVGVNVHANITGKSPKNIVTVKGELVS